MKLRNDIPDCLLGFLLCACLSSVCSAGTVPIDNDRARTSSACPPSGIDLIRTVATWAINSGGPATKYFGGNSPEGRRLRATDATIDTTGVPDPPPQEVYQSERWGYTRCDIGGLEPNGTYVIRLHFVETEHESPGKRQLDVHVNGAIRLRNYDIFAAAGAKYKAVAESLSVAADPSGSLVIEMVSVKDYARCSALELRDTAADPGTPGGLGPIVAAVNWGGNAVGLFQGDSGPGTSATNATIDTEGVAYPAPQIVYQSERFGDGGGTIDGLTPGGLYVVRLHFAELDWDSSGQRLFDVYVNDDLVLDDYDIVSRAGGKYKAVAEAFEVEATPSGTIGFRFTSVKDLATCNGIEILRVLETLEEGDSGVLYVDDDGPEDGDGSSWSRAYKHLQDALGCAKVGHEIRVAQGTYRPDQGQGLASGDTEAVFTLIYGVAVRGGYAGLGASDPNQRDVRTYATVLSGDLAGDDEDADLGSPEMMTDQKCRWENANNVVTCVDVDRSAVLDGFAISGGYYGGLTICDASPTITNCLFRHNMAMFGGAVWHCVLSDRTCEPLLANCVMVRNYAHYNGGAVYVEAASYRAECRPVVTSCAFVGNTARENGGALCGTNSESSACHLTLTNCTFLGNQAANAGGALYSDAEQGPCDLTVTNGILWANQSSSADPASAQISGGLPLIEHCCIQGWPGEPSDSGNTGENPRLTPDGHLTRQSPCIDACLSGPATDRDGDVRPNPAGGAYDMGADEFVDTDADGLPDWWERYATGSPTDLKPHEDFDGDGRLNLPEYERSSRGYPDLARAPDLRDIWSSYRLPISEPYEMPDSNAVPSGKVVYVDKSAPGRNDGTSWTDAYLYLQDALAAARAGDEIRVAQGAYYPDEGLGCEALDRGAAFHLTCSVRIRGGYAGSGGEDPNDRDIHRFRTVLTGDLAGNDAAFLNAQALLGDPSRQDNSTHVVLGVGTDSSTVLDGFVICGGNADGGEEGGGLYDLNGNTVIANCIFAHNTAIYGAGMGGITKNRSNLDDCYPALVNCLFVENAARTQGGGLFCRAYRDGDYHPTLTNCRFAGNYAGLDGGAICNWSETDYEVHPTLVQCVFVQNQAGQDGGGICCDNDWERTYPTLTNCAFLGNTAGRDGGGMMGTDTTHTLYNCLFSGNRAEQHGGALYARRGIMSTAPELVNCTVVGNTAAYSGGLGSDRNAKVELVNCILWRNADMRGQTLASQLEGDRFTVRYCCVQGWSDSDDEGGNRGLNPIFADAAGADDLPGTEDDDLRLLPGSPCVDAGDSGALPQMLAQDLAGGDRIVGACVDMGAFESTDPRVFLDIGPVVVVEGETGTFGVALLEDPGRPVQVTVTVASGDPDITTGSETTLCFDSGNYATPQVVVLAAAQDEDVLDGEVLISIHAPGVGATYVVATEQDDDVLSVLYVDARAQGAGTGTSWTDAFTDLQQALQTARALPDVNEIRVAQGTYRPAGAGQNEVSFELINGVAIKGGYAGIAAADPDARDIRRFQTILSGDLEGDDPNFTREWDYVDVFDLGDPSHNSFHVITDIGSDATAVLDGVTIAAGHAGYYGSGGGAYIVGGSPTFVDCRFERNLSGNYGGAVYCERGSPQFRNCVFTFNLATWGGGVYLKNGARPVFIDCLFEENDACDGSAFWSERWATIGQSALVHPVLIRCTFREYAGFGGTVIVPAGVGLTGEATIEDGLFADETRLANADVTIAGQVRITGQWRLHRTLLTGTGAVSIGQEAVLSQEVLGWPIVSQALVSKAGGDVSQVQCNLTGTGVLKVVPKTELVIEGQARAEVKHIQCDGLLRVRGNAEVHGAQVDVTQASFEGNAIVSNSVITAEAGVPYGQFFIEETARISHNEIHADGDRYMDLDPAVFDGLIANDNRIHVTVAEGIGRTRGGLLELRGRPGLIEPGQCHAGSPFLCQTEIVPEFGLESWTIEELHLVDGAKVNL
ncbi:MAG: hypothetical protein JW955_25110, partial [Sedimentisphaerales bacterium]|nr:hypothetical protein [Sedimentisphaerales bacterium]